MKKSHFSLFRTLFLTTFLVLVSISSAKATDFYTRDPLLITPDGVEATPPVWNNPLCWIPYYPGTTIGPNDRVFIGTLIEADEIINHGLIMIVDLVVVAGVPLNLPSLTVFKRLTITTTGKLINNYKLDIKGAITNFGTFTNGASATCTMSKNIIFDNYGSLQNSGKMTVESGCTINNQDKGSIIEFTSSSIANSGTLNLNAGSNFTSGASTTSLNAAALNWYGGNIVIASAFNLTKALEIPIGSTMEVRHSLNINPGGVLTLSNGSILKTSAATNGRVTLNTGGNMVYKGNVVLPSIFSWVGGTVTIAGINNNSIDVPSNGYLDIAPTGIFNLTNGTYVSISHGTSITNKGVINLNENGHYTGVKGAITLPNGRFNWNVGGIVEIYPECTLYVDQNSSIGAGRSIYNSGILNISGTFNVLGTLEIISEKKPNITGSGTLAIGNGGTLNLRTFNAATINTFPTIPLNLSQGSTIKIAAGATYALDKVIVIPSQCTFENNGKLDITQTGVLDNRASSIVINNGSLTNHGTLLNYENWVNNTNAIFGNYKTVVNAKNFINYGFIVNERGSKFYNSGRLYLDKGTTFLENGFMQNTGTIDLYGNFACGLSDIWKGGTVNTYKGSIITIVQPLTLGGSAYISEGAELKIANTFDIGSGALLINRGNISLVYTSNKMNLRTGGTYGIYSNASILPNLWETGSSISIGDNASVSIGDNAAVVKPTWTIPEGSTLYVNGRLTAYGLLTNNGTILVNGIVVAPLLLNRGRIEGSGTMFVDSYLYDNVSLPYFSPGNRNSTGNLISTTSLGNAGTIDLGNSTYECDFQLPTIDLFFTTGKVVLTNAILKVNFLTPPVAGVYPIMTYNSRQGEFSKIIFPTIQGFGFFIRITETQVLLTVRGSVPVLGDAGNCTLQASDLTATVNDTAVALAWNAVRGASKYKVQYRTVGTPAWTAIDTTGNATSLPMASLTAGGIYEWIVLSVCNDGFIGDTVKGNKFFLPCATVPRGVHLDSLKTTTAVLSWLAIDNVANYIISIKPTEPASAVRYVKSTTTNTVLTDLKPNAKYEISIRSVCSDSAMSNFSDTLTIATPEPCDPPATTVSDITYSSARINWENETFTQGYEIRYKVKGATNWITKTTKGNTTFLDLTKLAIGKTYEYQIRLQCPVGYSDYSSIQTFSIEACVAATPSIRSQTAKSITVEWEVQTGVAGYEVSYRKQGKRTWTNKVITGATIDSVVLKNLTKNTTYEIRMLTKCLALNGISGYSATIQTTIFNPAANLIESQNDNILRDISLTVSPNPTNGIVSLQIESTGKGIGKILVSDNIGRIVLTVNEIAIEGLQVKELDLSHLTNGFYFIRFISADYSTMQKVLLSK